MAETYNFNFVIRLADLTVNIRCAHDDTVKLCRTYELSDGAEDTADINAFVDKEACEEEKKVSPGFSDGYIESICMYRSIAEQLPVYDRMVVHGAAVTWNGKAYLFTAPSGTGKSTHIRLWRKFLGAGVDIVNGDKPILSVSETEVRVYGTPWAGKENWQQNTSAPLAGICFLSQGVDNRIQKLRPGQCLGKLIGQVYLPKEEAAAGKTLELVNQLITGVPLYALPCDMSETAVRCSFEALTGEQYIGEKEQ